MSVDIGRVGIWIRAEDELFDPIEDAVAELDELGYGTLWLGSSPEHSLALPESLLGGSRRIVIATGIISVWAGPADRLAARHHELTTAYPGRFMLGLGVSHERFVGRRYQKPYDKLVSYLDELDAAADPVPVGERILAALGPRMMALAGARSAGAHPYLVTPEHTAVARQLLGHGPLLVPEQKVVLETDPYRARKIARDVLSFYLALPAFVSSFSRLGFAPTDLAGEGSDRLVDAMVAWGDAAAIRARITEHYSAGADHVAVQVLTANEEFPREQWRELAPAILAA